MVILSSSPEHREDPALDDGGTHTSAVNQPAHPYRARCRAAPVEGCSRSCGWKDVRRSIPVASLSFELPVSDLPNMILMASCHNRLAWRRKLRLAA
jgi:hypothetical protein